MRAGARARIAAGGLALSLLGGCGGSEATTTARPTGTAPAAARRTPAQSALPGAAEQAAAVQRFARIGKPIYCGAGRDRLVALTFDDGPGPYTGIALRELRKAGAHATFFLVARSIERYPAWPPRERAAAAIGEHTMTHPFLPGLTTRAAYDEIAGGQRAAQDASGGPVTLFRPPYGGRNATIDRMARSMGMAQILWDVDSTDSRISPPANFHDISAHVRHAVRPGSIVLLHENRGQTIRALRAILPALHQRRLRPVSVPELLAADPPSRSQLDEGRRGCRA